MRRTTLGILEAIERTIKNLIDNDAKLAGRIRALDARVAALESSAISDDQSQNVAGES